MDTNTPVVPEEKLQRISINLYGYSDKEVTIKEVEDKLNELRNTVNSLNRRVDEMRNAVRSAFRDQIESDTDKAEFDLEDTNYLLREIGAKEIAFTYSTTVQVSITISGIEADSAEEAERKALEAVDVRVHTERCGDNAEVENEEYETEDTEEDDN